MGRWGAATLLFCLVWVWWDVGKTKAVSKSKYSKGTKVAADGNKAIEQAAGTEAADTGKKKRPVRCIQRHTDVEFRREFREVFNGLVEKAKGGGTAQTRLLLQIGKFGDPKAVKRRGTKSLSEMLMDELKRRQDERETAADAAKLEAQTTGSE